MIELYRLEKSKLGDEIEDVLRELVLAHRVIIVDSAESKPEMLTPNTPLPALKDEGQIISGEPAIKAHLRTLEQLAHNWRKFQSDSCYMDENGEIC